MSSFSPLLEQGNAADLRGIDVNAAMHHLALGQGMKHEHGVDGLQIVLGREIHDGEIFVVEFAMLLRGIAIAFARDGGTLAVASMCDRDSC